LLPSLTWRSPCFGTLYGVRAERGKFSRPDPASQVAWLKANGYAGFRVYDFENPANQAYLGKLVDDGMDPGNWSKS